MEVTDGFSKAPVCGYIRIDPPGAPIARDDVYPCPFGLQCQIPLAQSILLNDESPNNLTLTIVGQPTPSEGNVTVNPDGSFKWDPPA